jgi:hypothetical protein
MASKDPKTSKQDEMHNCNNSSETSTIRILRSGVSLSVIMATYNTGPPSIYSIKKQKY